MCCHADESAAGERSVVPCGESCPEDPVFAGGVDVVDVALPDAIGRAVDETTRCVVEHRSKNGSARRPDGHRSDGFRTEQLQGGLVRREHLTVETQYDGGSTVGIEEFTDGER